MTDNQTTTAVADELTIPEDLLQKFPELIKGIKASQSMNREERQYWIDVLPIMSQEQIDNLKNILDNEKQQIEEANREFDETVEEGAKNVKVTFDEFRYKEKKRLLRESESLHEKEEKEHEAELLKELENL